MEEPRWIDYISRKLTFLSQICNGLLPILYNMERNPDWNVFLNMFICVEIFFFLKYIYRNHEPPPSFHNRNQCVVVQVNSGLVSLGASFLFVHARQKSCYGNLPYNNLVSNLPGS